MDGTCCVACMFRVQYNTVSVPTEESDAQGWHLATLAGSEAPSASLGL
jgi:hypothetical protein